MHVEHAEGLFRAVSGPFFSPDSDRHASAAQFQVQKGELTTMARRSFPIFLACMALFATSVSVRAKNDASDTITASIKLTSTTSIGAAKLAPGDYKLIVEGTKAKFEQHGK